MESAHNAQSDGILEPIEFATPLTIIADNGTTMVLALNVTQDILPKMANAWEILLLSLPQLIASALNGRTEFVLDVLPEHTLMAMPFVDKLTQTVILGIYMMDFV